MHIGKHINRYINSFILRIVGMAVAAVVVILIIIGAVLWHLRQSILRYVVDEYGRMLVASQSMQTTPVKEAVPQKTETPAPVVPAPQKELSSLIEDAVAKANPAVVAVTIYQTVPKYQTTFKEYSPAPGITFQVPQQEQVGTEDKVVGSGSGFLVTSDGLIVTNRHAAIGNASSFSVTLQNGKKYSATVLSRDPILDIAIMKITGSGFPYVRLGDSDALKLGQSVIAIGNALVQFQNTVSVGIISGLSRSITASSGQGETETLDKVIQTDAAINPGNSGGPLLDTNGMAVGVNVAIVQGSQNIGFSIPINVVKSIISSAKKISQNAQ